MAEASWTPLVAIVDFHHARGPEVEAWFGAEDGVDPALKYDWPLIPFMALTDGAHATLEDFSYFTLMKPGSGGSPATSLFGISCTRQLASTELKDRPAEVTRSTVQKAVVVIADSPHLFDMLRERLSVVTSAWFSQKDFSETEILQRFQDSLKDEAERGRLKEESNRDQYLGMSLRQLVREFRWQTLVLLKCCLLQPKMLFFGTKCERLCMMQFSLISLIPGLIRNLADCASPDLDGFEKSLLPPTNLRTSDRNSVLTYMGLPLQLFGKGSLFGPYTPLQQLDILADHGTKSYIVGSTNSLLLQQKDRYSDILINLDEDTINITSPSLRTALNLTIADRRWIDFLTQSVNDTWDDANPDRPNTLGYVGSSEFIRLQFEEYLLSMLAAVKCSNYMAKHAANPHIQLPDVDGDPAADFGTDWIEAWSRTANYKIWDRLTDDHIFDVVEPRHPCAGGLTIDDVQRRVAQQVQDLHLDEKFAVGKEILGEKLAAGRERAGAFLNKVYADMEVLRENQRRRAEEQKAAAAMTAHDAAAQSDGATSPTTGQQRIPLPAIDLAKAQATAVEVKAKAATYVSSWAAWAGEKRKGWVKSQSPSASNSRRTSEDPDDQLPPEFVPRDITPKLSMSEGKPVATGRSQLTEEEIPVDFVPRDITPKGSIHGSEEISEKTTNGLKPDLNRSYTESIFDADEHHQEDESLDQSKSTMADPARDGFEDVKLEDSEATLVDSQRITDASPPSASLPTTPPLSKAPAAAEDSATPKQDPPTKELSEKLSALSINKSESADSGFISVPLTGTAGNASASASASGSPPKMKTYAPGPGLQGSPVGIKTIPAPVGKPKGSVKELAARWNSGA